MVVSPGYTLGRGRRSSGLQRPTSAASIAPEQFPIADVAPQHGSGAVPGLAHDDPLLDRSEYRYYP